MSEATTSGGQPTSDEELLDEFLLDAEVQGLTEKTRVTYRSDLEYFIDWLDCTLLEIGRHELKGFLSRLVMVTTLNITLDDADAERLKENKNQLGLTWEEYLLLTVDDPDQLLEDS